MKTTNFETSFDNFAVFTLSNEEMLTIRGGGDETGPGTNPATPPIKL